MTYTIEKLIELRYTKGLTLKAIGLKFGLSKQRIAQILNKPENIKYKPNIITEKEVAKLLKVSQHKIRIIRWKKLIAPKLYGVTHQYTKADIVAVKKHLINRAVCRDCGKKKKLDRKVLCRECYSKNRKTGEYKNATPERKKQILASIKRWQLKNPEKYKVIARRASKKYGEKHSIEHFSKTRYIVRGNSECVSEGEIVQAIRSENRTAILTDGRSIPFRLLKKINE